MCVCEHVLFLFLSPDEEERFPRNISGTFILNVSFPTAIDVSTLSFFPSFSLSYKHHFHIQTMSFLTNTHTLTHTHTHTHTHTYTHTHMHVYIYNYKLDENILKTLIKRNIFHTDPDKKNKTYHKL